MRLLTINQVAEMLGVSRTQVNRYRHDDDYAHLGFPRPLVLGIKVLFLEAEVFDWLQKRLDKR